MNVNFGTLNDTSFTLNPQFWGISDRSNLVHHGRYSAIRIEAIMIDTIPQGI